MRILSGPSNQTGVSELQHVAVVMLLQFWMIHMRGQAAALFFFFFLALQQMRNVTHSCSWGRLKGVHIQQSCDYLFHWCDAVGGIDRRVKECTCGEEGGQSSEEDGKL